MWNDLTLSDKARMIQLAVKSGITDLNTIQSVYNEFANGGYKKPKGASLLKHLAYKIGADQGVSGSGGAGIGDIVRAITKKNTILDDNKYAYIYGTGDRYPEVEEPIRGFDYTNYLNKNGYTGVKDVYGIINPNNEYHIDEKYENLAKELAKHRYHFYDNADDMFLDSDPDNLGYRDDVANFIHRLDLDDRGNVLVHDSDVYDFNPADYTYSRDKFKPLMSLEAKMMDKIGTPYTIRQEYQPLYFDGERRGSQNIQQHLEELTDADIARITESGLLPEAVVGDYRNGGKIHIKPENRGKFTALKERTGKSASWFKAHGTPAQKKMATFALNARKWKHEDGGPLEDYSGITTTNHRRYNPDYVSYIDTAFSNAGLSDVKRASLLANIIEESGGNPFALDDTGQFYGLMQWAGDRYSKGTEKDPYKEIDNQVNYILSTLGNTTDKVSWTHGGKGSGYNSYKDAMADFDADDLATAMKGLTLGYVRPTGKLDSYNNRLKVAEQLFNRYNNITPAKQDKSNIFEDLMTRLLPRLKK